MIIENYLQNIQEGYIFSDKTISIDLDKFISGESNKLIIAGLSGGGKTTLCRYLAEKYNAECYETDDCSRFLTEDEFKLFVNDEEFKKQILGGVTPIKKVFKKVYEKCLRPLILSKKRYILEGGLLWEATLFFPEIRKEVEEYPVIIMGTSALQSSIRDLTRHKTWDNPRKIYRSYIKNFLLLNKLLEEYRKQRTISGRIEEFEVGDLTSELPKLILTVTKKIMYDNFTNEEDYIMRDKKKIIKDKKGVCYDIVELERALFNKYNFKFKTFFAYNEPVNDSPTHTFLIYEYKREYFWFESAMKINEGIHGPFKSYQEGVRFVLKQLKNGRFIGNPKVREYEKFDFTGMNLNEFADYIMTHFKEIKVWY